MSSPTQPTTDPGRSAAQPRPLVAQLAHYEEASLIDVSHATPPAEVLEQMAQADALNTRLRDSGRELTFSPPTDHRKLEIDLRDSAGKLLRSLSATEATDIAAGDPVE